MVNSLENIDKSKVDVSRIEGIEEEIQSQISGSITGAASTIVTSDLTANKILVSDANGKVAASAKAISDIPNDSNLVHTSGNETINGVKTFNDTTYFVPTITSITTNQNSGLSVQKSNVTKGTAPSSNINSRFLLQSKDGFLINQRLSSFELYYNTNGTTSAEMKSYKPEFDSTTGAIIGVYYPASGDPYTSAPTPATDDNSTKIATTAFVKSQGYAVDSGVVHTSGNETIAGNKTFSSTISGSINGNAATVTNGVYTNTAQTISATKTFTANQVITKAKPILQLKDTSITRNTAPSAAVNSIAINGLDSAGKNTWGIYHTWGTDKKAQTQLICYKGTSTDNTFSAIGVGYDASGNAFTNAPTPATSDNSTKIATTAYVKSNLTALLPVGTIISFAGSSTPTGFLKCDGSAVSRTTYSSLYSAIGTTYGTGDGSSTFNLPNGSNRSLWGNGRNKAISSGAPDITGNYNHQCLMNYGTGTEEGALYTSSGAADAQYAGGTGGGNTQTIGFKASKSNSIYGATTYIRPQSIGIVFFIKY